MLVSFKIIKIEARSNQVNPALPGYVLFFTKVDVHFPQRPKRKKIVKTHLLLCMHYISQ